LEPSLFREETLKNKKILEKKKQKLWQKEEKDVEIIRVC
jgi:hypothetical protein